MNSFQLKGIDSNLRQVVLENLQNLKQHLDEIRITSDQIRISNLIQETKDVLKEAYSANKTYQEKYTAFMQVTEAWFNVWNHYREIPEAIDLGIIIDRIANYSVAYSYLFLSLSLINEGRVGENRADLERIVSGFLLLSEIVDVFIDFFSISELEQIYSGAKNAIAVSARSIKEYFEDGLELSNLDTQLRAYSSLIILKVEEQIKNVGSTIDEDIRLKSKLEDASSKPWWEQIAGTFANNSVYDEAMQLGREYRDSLRSSSIELLDE